MTKSIRVDEDIHKRARVAAASGDVTLQYFTEAALVTALDKIEAQKQLTPKKKAKA